MADVAAVTRIDITATDNTAAAVASSKAALKEVEGAAGALESQFRSMAAALGISISVAGLVEYGRNVVSTAEDLQRLSQVTGSSVESLSAISNAAYVAGVGADYFRGMMERMTSNMETISPTSTRAMQAMAALGVTARDPAEALKEVAAKLDEYANSAGKAAAMRDIFGRGGAEMAAALHAIAAAGADAATITSQDAAEAQRFSEQIREITVAQNALKDAILRDFVPTLALWIENVKIARDTGLSWWDSLMVGTTYVGQMGPALTTARANLEKLTGYLNNLKQAAADDPTDQQVQNDLARMQAKWDNAKKILDALLAAQRNAALSLLPTPKGDERPDLPWTPSDTAAQTAEINKLQTAIQALDEQTAKYQRTMTGAKETDTELIKVFDDYDARQRQLISTGKEMTATEAALWDARAAAAINTDKAAVAEGDYAAAMKDSKKSWDEYAKGFDDAQKNYGAYLDNIQRENDKLRDNAGAFGLSTDAQRIHVVQMQIVAAAHRGDTDAVKALTEQLDLLNQKATADSMAKAAKDAEREWAHLADDVDREMANAFSNMLFNGQNAFRDLARFAEQLFAKLVLQPLLQPIANSIAGGMAGMFGLPGALNTGGGGGGIFSGLGNLFGFGGTGAGSTSFGIDAIGSDWAIGAPTTGMFAGVAGGLGAGLAAAMPYIGVGLLAYSLLSGMFGKGGGPKQGGYGAWGAPTGATSSGKPGFFPDEWTGAGNAAMSTFTGQWGTDYAAALAAMGGTGKGGPAGFAAGFDTDPQGTAQSRYSIRASVGGNVVYDVHDINAGRDDATLQAAMKTGSERALLAALQASDLPENIKKIIDSVSSATGTDAEIEAVIAKAEAFQSAYKTITDAITRNPLDDALKAIADSVDPAYSALGSMNTALNALGDAFTGTTDQSAALATATVTYYNALVNELATIEHLKDTLNKSGQDAIRSMTLQTMTPVQQWQYLRREATTSEQQMMGAATPADVQRLHDQTIADIRAAFNLLTPDQQKQNLPAYIAAINRVDTESSQRLTQLEDAVRQQADDTFNHIRDIMDKVADKMGTAATKQDDAANKNLAAAVTPVQVVVTGHIYDSAGTEVGNFA